MSSLIILASLIAFAIGVAAMVVFFNMAGTLGKINDKTEQLVELIEYQNKILQAIFKQSGGKINDLNLPK